MPKIVFSFGLFLFILFSLASRANAYQPPGQSGCPNLAKIPVSVEPTSGTQTTQFKVTLLWEQMLDKDVQRYQELIASAVYPRIYVNESSDPNDLKRPEISGQTDILPQELLNKVNAVRSISVLTAAGQKELFVHLAVDDLLRCVGYEESSPSIKFTRTIGDPNAKPLERGKYCDITLQGQTSAEFKSLQCPADAPCRPTTANANGPYACGGGAALCEVQGICLTLFPTTVPLNTLDCDPEKGDCTEAAGAKCNSQTGEAAINGDGVSTVIGCVPTEPTQLVKGLLRIGTSIGGGIAFLLMVYGAFLWITSGGNPDNLKKAQDQFINAGVGLLFIIFSIMLLKIIGVDILQIPGFSP